ncbi:MAG: DUF6588 family protein [Elusimicrobiota bacterium]
MKKFFSAVAICCFIFSYGFSATPDFDTLINKLGKEYVEPLAKDMGSVLAGGMFRSGRTLATIPGIDVGIRASLALKPSADDEILKTSMGDEMFGLPFIQLSKGLPKRFELTLRGFPETQGIKMLGVGVKYGIMEREIAVVKLGLSAMYSYNQLQHSNFKATTNSFAGIFSVKVPVVEPYLGFAIDSTKLETDFTVVELAGASFPTNVNVSVSQPRYVAGLNFSLIPFTYINVAGTYAVDHYGVDFGLGLSF